MSFHAVAEPGSYRYTRDPYIDGGPITNATRITDEAYPAVYQAPASSMAPPWYRRVFTVVRDKLRGWLR